MDQYSGDSANWQDGEFLMTTAEPGILVSAVEDVPTLTIATIIGVTAVVVVAIVIVFVLGVLIDCRQQRLLEKKMGEMRRLKKHRRAKLHPEGDGVGIVDNMEEGATSVPPAAALRNIP